MALFEQKAPAIMAALIRDLGMADYQAGGVLGNIGWECGGFQHLSQIGGTARGWVQWDGARKKQFLAWCEKNGLVWTSDEANYRYLVLELRGSEHAALVALLKTRTLVEASDTFEEKFERAGKPALSGRRRFARQAMDAYAASDKKPLTFGPAPPPQPAPLPPRPPDMDGPVTPPQPAQSGGFFNALFALLRRLFGKE